MSLSLRFLLCLKEIWLRGLSILGPIKMLVILSAKRETVKEMKEMAEDKGMEFIMGKIIE